MLVGILLRGGQMLVVVLAAITIAFFVLRLAAGDPAQLMTPPGTPKEVVAQVRQQIGTDKPLMAQYVEFLASIPKGDLGTSFRGGQPVATSVMRALPNTLALAAITVVVASALGLLLGMTAAWRANTVVDRAILVYVALAQAAPAFWLAVVLVLFFSLRLGWFPAIGLAGPTSFVLPVATLVVTFTPILIRTVRQSFLETLGEDYIRAARARGLPERRVLLVHGLKVASLPLVTIIGLQTGFLLAGAFVVESVFNWPGIGKLTLDAVASRDFPMIQGGILVAAVAFVVVSFLVDFLYTVLNPRTRLART